MTVKAVAWCREHVGKGYSARGQEQELTSGLSHLKVDRVCRAISDALL